MKFENLFINHSLTNGLIDNLKENPDIIGFIMAGLDHGFKASIPGSVLMTYNKVIIGCHTAGENRNVWITHVKSKIVLKLFVVEKFDWDCISIIRGCLYYKNILICKTA